MELSDEDVKEFVDLWEAEFGERLTMEIGRAEAKRLLDFFVTISNARLSNRLVDRGNDDATMQR
jgi:hypothetical protein